MKLSFSLSTKPSSKLKPSKKFNAEDLDQSNATKEYVTEFDASKTLADAKSKKLVIPPKPNEWRSHKKMRNLDLPVQSDGPNNLQFEVDPTSVAEPDNSNVSYGLNLRQSIKNDADANAESDKPNPNPNPNPSSIEGSMLQKLREDLNRLPEDRGFEEFDDVPVEGFGAAVLAGYGWYEGRGIGRNAKEDVKVVQYEKRTDKEGLGFVSEMLPPKSNSGMLPPKSKDGSTTKVVHTKKLNESEGGRYSVGKDVRIVGGRDAGLKGRIVQVMGGGDSVVLKLSRSEEEVTARVRDVAELGSVEEERCLKKLKELKIRGSKDERGKNLSNGRSHSEGSDEAKVKHDKRKDSKRNREGVDRREESRSSSQVSWLSSHIRVRVISKELKGGKLYLKKGKIVDVVGPMTCDISMDDSRELIQGVDQELLETALPRRGGPVLVLYGKHKGVYGNLVEKDTENEIGVVRDADTHHLINVRLEQMAEYLGDPSYIGY